MGKRTDFCINGTEQSRGQSASKHFKVSEAIRLMGEGLSMSKISKMVGIEYKLLNRLIDARQEK